ncbi:DUF4430 domain-containing protein [Bacillus suaedae]|uniref:DUF4430 domain-containing protein n=1 Tax=Halalkalibacter suaedae TaxID=2822140 RepID=A0A941ATR2_9BACI|nr:DUF4430 domain-containing protein [Bacillus suaedae]MBP3952469.1 DUF4430 domain-containing protein [Bacillus suaedae]
MKTNKKALLTFCLSIIFILSLLGCGANDKIVESTPSVDNVSGVEENEEEVVLDEEDPNTDVEVEQETKEVEAEETETNASEAEVEKESSSSTAKTEETPPTKTVKEKEKASDSTNQKTKQENDASKPAQSNTKEEKTKVSPKPSQTETPKKEEVAKETVSIVINGPKSVGTISGKTTVVYQEGDTALSILLRHAKNSNIVVDASGSGPTAYVHGIANYYEFDFGSTSGWIAKINGAGLTKGAGVSTVKAGDQIEWLYTE